jgi:hypothetical protein
MDAEIEVVNPMASDQSAYKSMKLNLML